MTQSSIQWILSLNRLSHFWGQVHFRFANNVSLVSGATAPVPVYTGESPQAPPRQAVLDRHYQTAMKCELAKIGLL